MNTISKRNVGLFVLVILLVCCLNPAFGLGRKGRGSSFMRAFGMKVQDDSFAQSYYEWSTTLAGKTGVNGTVGPVLAAYGDNFGSIFYNVNGFLTNGLNFIGFNAQYQVDYPFLPYSYKAYRGYR